MHRLRVVEGLTLGQIGARFGLGAERVRQLINQHLYRRTGRRIDAKAISSAAAQIRREKDLAAAHAQAEAILAAWRAGEQPAAIAKRLGLRKGSVSAVIAGGRRAGGGLCA